MIKKTTTYAGVDYSQTADNNDIYSSSHTAGSTSTRSGASAQNTLTGAGSPIRVFLAHESMTECRRIVGLLSPCTDMVVVGYATSLSELEMAVHVRHDIDVLITDVLLHKQDTTRLFLSAKEKNPELNVLCRTDCENEEIVFTAIQNGATGYILRSSGEALPNCIRLIHGGGSPVSPTVARRVLRTLFLKANAPAAEPRPADNTLLSDREREVLQLLAKGISFAEIGNVLAISTHTVTAHIKKIYRKLQVHSRGEAVYEAKCLGILED